MAEAWAPYINQMINKYNFKTMEVKWNGECDEAAIFGLDGTGWYWSPGFPDINQPSQVTIEGMTEADTKVVTINEFECVKAAADGNRNPSEAGIRIGGKKYMMVRHDPSTGLAQLTTPGGGAAVMKTQTGLVVALFTKDKQCTDPATGGPMKGKFQTQGGCAEQV